MSSSPGPVILKNFPGTAAAVAKLWRRCGRRLALCGPDRRPLLPAAGGRRLSWQARRRWRDIEQHLYYGGILGWIPGDAGLIILDCDRGDYAALTAEYPPRLILPSRTAGRAHLVYDAPPAYAGKGRWQYAGAGGEVIHQGGYAALWYGAADALVDELDNPAAGEFPFPLEILPDCPRRPAGRVMAEAGAIGRSAATTTVPAGENRRRLIHSVDALLGMVEGDGRNDTLFDYTRTQAYKARPGPVSQTGLRFADWHGQVYSVAAAANPFFAQPLPLDEVRSIAQSIALYCWHNPTFAPGGGRHGGADAEAYGAIQSLRQSCQVAQRQAANRKRDRDIVRARLSGVSLRDTAQQFEVSVGCVRGVLRRYAADDNDPAFWDLWRFEEGRYV